MLTALRLELNTLMAAAQPSRKPALRHANREGWLLCSDVPSLLDEAALTALCDQLHAAGWQTQLQNGWLYFDKPVPVPVVDMAAEFPGEVGCVVSLLRRHNDAAPCGEAIRLLCCAHDKGAVQVERLCRTLHQQMAEKLRLHQPLPGGLLPYVIRAATDDKGGR